WEMVNDMQSARNGHTLTYIGENKILAVGGYDGTFNLKTAELYNVASDEWSYVDDMDSIRFEHTATLLDNGNVLIAGGWNGSSLNYFGTQIFNPDTELFSDGPDMHVGRSGHTATKMNDGRVLIVGGYNGPSGNTDVVDIYDPITNEMVTAASLHKGRSYHTASLLTDGRVIVTGGFNPDYGFQMNSVEIYDPVTDNWTEAAPMAFIRDYHAAAVFKVGGADKLLVSGGRYFNGIGYEGIAACEMYDVATNTWTMAALLPQPQSYHKMIPYTIPGSDCNAHIVCIGGTDESGYGIDLTFSTTYVYCTTSNTWTSLPMNVDGRYFYAAAPFPNPESGMPAVIVSGGFDATAEILYLPAEVVSATNTSFTQLDIMPNPTDNALRFSVQNGAVNHYTILTIEGKMVAQGVLNAAVHAHTINISALSNGAYILLLSENFAIVAQGFFIK
ncbi:MAG: kelch repeat-containing protein, partial [Chitinophagales bacterium]